MKKAAIISVIAFFFAPVNAWADPGHPAIYEAYEWLHYFTSVRHLISAGASVLLVVVIYKGIKLLLKPAKKHE